MFPRRHAYLAAEQCRSREAAAIRLAELDARDEPALAELVDQRRFRSQVRELAGHARDLLL